MEAGASEMITGACPPSISNGSVIDLPAGVWIAMDAFLTTARSALVNSAVRSFSVTTLARRGEPFHRNCVLSGTKPDPEMLTLTPGEPAGILAGERELRAGGRLLTTGTVATLAGEGDGVPELKVAAADGRG
jgi:hypothetical protein